MIRISIIPIGAFMSLFEYGMSTSVQIPFTPTSLGAVAAEGKRKRYENGKTHTNQTVHSTGWQGNY